MTKARKNAPRSTSNRTRRLIKKAPTAMRVPKTALSGVAKSLIAGGTVVAAGAGATAAVLMRRQIAKLAAGVTAEAVSAGHSAGAFRGKLGKSLRRQAAAIDLTRLMPYPGLNKRPSLMSRLLPSAGIATLVAAAGAAIVLIAPKLRAAVRETKRDNRMDDLWSAPLGSVADSSAARGSTGQAVDGAAHAGQ
jgi:hypothetical protein